MRRPAVLVLACLGAGTALAEVSVVSSRPDAVSLTIYREGLALITETRRVELPGEPVTLVFQGVVDSLLPRSAVLDGAGRAPAETDFRFDRLTPASLLQRSVGKVVTIVRTAPRSGVVSRREATVVAAGEGVVLRSVEGNEALYCAALPERLEFAELPGELTPAPTLSMRLGAGPPGPRTIRISYLAHGFSWSADYVAHLDGAARRMDLAGWLTLHNDTGTAFAQAEVQVVAGRLNLLDFYSGGSRPSYRGFDERSMDEETGLPATRYEQQREQEQQQAETELALLRNCYPLGKTTDALSAGFQFPPLRGMDPAFGDRTLHLVEVTVTGSRIVDRSQLGDYQLYRLPWPTDLNARQTKQAAFLDRKGIKVERFYSIRVRGFEAGETEPEDAPELMLRWRNERSAGLGEPLPAGQVRVFEPRAGGAVFAGEAAIRDSPVGLRVEIAIARALDLAAGFTLEPRRQNKGEREFVRIAASHRFVNNKDAAVRIEVRRPDDAAFATPVVLRSNRRARRERGGLVWQFELPAGREFLLRYELKAAEREQQ